VKGAEGERRERGRSRGRREGKQCTKSLHLGVRLNYIMEETDCASPVCRETDGYQNNVETG